MTFGATVNPGGSSPLEEDGLLDICLREASSSSRDNDFLFLSIKRQLENTPRYGVQWIRVC